MILSKSLTFSENQAVTTTAVSTNVVQFPATGTVQGEAAAIVRKLGPGNEIPLLMQVTESFATLTSLTITLETSANSDLSSSTVLWTSGAIPVASLVAGYRPNLRILPDGAIDTYLGLRYTVTGSAATAGKITAALATEVDAG